MTENDLIRSDQIITVNRRESGGTLGLRLTSTHVTRLVKSVDLEFGVWNAVRDTGWIIAPELKKGKLYIIIYIVEPS